MNTTINDITRQLNTEVQKVSVKGRLQKKVIRPFALEYYFELVPNGGGIPMETRVGWARENHGEPKDNPIFCYTNTIDEAIDQYRQFCVHMNVQPDPDTEQYLRGRVEWHTENVCLLIFERLIEIG